MPQIVIIAGPNGAGKTTASRALLADHVGIRQFVNADAIATGLSAFNPEGAALEAGRIMIARLRDLAAAGEDFAFETTLASRTFAPWLAKLKNEAEYQIDLYFFWLPDPGLSVSRVASRVSRGGHHVDSEVVRRRYGRGISNFFTLYRPLTRRWKLLDSSNPGGPTPIAQGSALSPIFIHDAEVWDKIVNEHERPTRQDV
jgi:predicted ABC-type ATPase